MENIERKTLKTKPSGWSWAHGVILSFVLFCSFVIYVVVRAFQQDVDLVTDTYYLEELHYQERMEERSNLVYSGLEVALQQTKEEVVLQFPEGFKTAKGEIHFYHPSRELFDQHYAIALNDQNAQSIAKEELIKGNYKVKITWTVNDIPYFQEMEIFLR